MKKINLGKCFICNQGQIIHKKDNYHAYCDKCGHSFSEINGKWFGD